MFNLNVPEMPKSGLPVKAVFGRREDKWTLMFSEEVDGELKPSSFLDGATSGYLRKDSTDERKKFFLVNKSTNSPSEYMAEVVQEKKGKRLFLNFYKYFTVEELDKATNEVVTSVKRDRYSLKEDGRSFDVYGIYDPDTNKAPNAEWQVVFNLIKTIS